jgi:hypothetical protein
VGNESFVMTSGWLSYEGNESRPSDHLRLCGRRQINTMMHLDHHDHYFFYIERLTADYTAHAYEYRMTLVFFLAT